MPPRKADSSTHTPEQLRTQIAALVGEYARHAYRPQPLLPGTTVIPPSGKVIGEAELQKMLAASLEG